LAAFFGNGSRAYPGDHARYLLETEPDLPLQLTLGHAEGLTGVKKLVQIQ
jgi:hypothetical protein